MEWVYNIIIPPFKFDFMMKYLKQYHKYMFIWVLATRLRSPLTIILSRKLKKEAKPHGENPPSRKEKAQN